MTRATAYFKHDEFRTSFEAWRTVRRLGSLPVVSLQAEICRDDLLFEIEVDAAEAS